MLITGAALLSGESVDIRIGGGHVLAVEPGLDASRGEPVFELAGGTVLPGLHDHHVHLWAMAAAERSVRVGPPEVTDAQGFRSALRDAKADADGWIRAIGYHESVAGPVDRRDLDEIEPSRPVRIQHRSGAMWLVNSAGLAKLGISDHPDGRVFRQDRLFAGLTGKPTLDLSHVSRRLTSYGVTGVTEATPDLDAADIEMLAAEIDSGRLAQHLHVLGVEPQSVFPRMSFGAVKRILDDATLDVFELEQWIGIQHAANRLVAVHCVTDVQLVATISALSTVGVLPGDRIEHAAVVPDDCLAPLVDLGLTVVTQPNFVAERGIEYLSDIPTAELPSLWRVASLIDSGIAVAGSTDAPFGSPDPWAAMRAARDRRVSDGRRLGPDESITARMALELFLGIPHEPAVPRQVVPGMAADLCLLSARPREVLGELTAELVAATVIAGRVTTSAK
ncbi:amidohydrolase family protein [Gordonia sp. NPDC058843]|uniref:amidohydrolase family protein n=1 Tax=Gordonia sp. NPDC058843 TaxID=3346648 RepID=UPI003673CED8